MLSGRWFPETKARLERLIAQHAGPGRLAVFDFDNTILCRDVGDTTLAYLATEGWLDPEWLAALSPPFGLLDAEIRLDDGALVYYEALQQATAHAPDEHTAPASGYVWAVQVLAGLTLDTLLHATRQGLHLAEQGGPAAPYPLPFVYPEMADLLGMLRRHEVDLRIVSATNVWSARWMVQQFLNPVLQRLHGPGAVVAPHEVLGMGLLLQDQESGGLYRDAHLVHLDPAYAHLDPEALARYRLTPHLDHPLPTFTGKVAALLQHVGPEPPLLAAGDSLNDLAVLRHATHRLWIARLDDPALQAAAAPLADDAWLLQPVLTGPAPGFLDRRDAIPERQRTGTVASALRPWLRRGRLLDF